MLCRTIALIGTGSLCLAGTASATLLAHYKLDGDATDAVASNDLTAYNNGISANPVINAAGGAAGGYASFDGGNLFNTTFVPVTGDASRTLSLWVRSTTSNVGSLGSNTTFIAGWGSPAAATRVRFDLGLEANSDDKLRNEYNSGFTNSSTGTSVTDGNWHHLVVTWDGDTDTASFFLDGNPYGTDVEGANLSTGTTVGLSIGADTRAAGVLAGLSTNLPNRFWIGDIDDVQVYDTALLLSDVQTLFNSPGTAIGVFDPADLDQDGDVDDADFGIAFAAFTGPNNGPSSNPAADLDNDGDVDDADFGLAFAAFTGPGGAAAVPEPASLALVGLGGLLIARRRRA